jgi:hypothetical protein
LQKSVNDGEYEAGLDYYIVDEELVYKVVAVIRYGERIPRHDAPQVQ